jgi:hypothetical protein
MLDTLKLLNYDFEQSYQLTDMGHKLFCTFTTVEELDELLYHLQTSYTILFSKIFVLKVHDQPEYVCTYNIEPNLMGTFPDNTILVHRKKESNTLYTINALNELIVRLNNGVLDKSFKIDWNRYRNCILLTKGNEFKKLNTSLHKIVEVERFPRRSVDL